MNKHEGNTVLELTRSEWSALVNICLDWQEESKFQDWASDEQRALAEAIIHG